MQRLHTATHPQPAASSSSRAAAGAGSSCSGRPFARVPAAALPSGSPHCCCSSTPSSSSSSSQHHQAFGGSHVCAGPSSGCAGPQHQHQPRGRVVAGAQQRERSGPSGLNVAGHTPTSPAGWAAMRAMLQEAGVKVLSPQEVVFLAERGGCIIIDVRPEEDYEKGHIPGAFNIPMYRPITGWDPSKIARRVGYAMFGILKGTEPNPSFAAEVRGVLQQQQAAAAAAPGSGSGTPLVLYCSQGGFIEPNDTYTRGWQTRSVIAAFDLVSDGLPGASVSVLRDGYTGWYNSGRECEIIEFTEENDGVTA